MEVEEKACGCIISQNNKILLIRQMSGMWGFPKGHVEEGETEEQTAKREVKEETGLSIDSPILCGITDWCNEEDRDVVLLYKSTSFSGELKSSDEGEVWWERYDNLRNLKLTQRTT